RDASAKTDRGTLASPPKAVQPFAPVGAERERAWWKDPIVTVGWGGPLLVLALFCGYIAWPHVQTYTKRRRPLNHQLVRAVKQPTRQIPSTQPEHVVGPNGGAPQNHQLVRAVKQPTRQIPSTQPEHVVGPDGGAPQADARIPTAAAQTEHIIGP